MKRVGLVGATTALAIVMMACGSEGGSTFDDKSGTPQDGLPNGTNGLPDIGTTGTASACVNTVASATLAPTNLVFMYDRSGSMGQEPNFDPAKKWIPVSDGMKAFFADPYSKTLQASLQFFPDGDRNMPGETDQQSVDDVCGFDYATPKVALASAADGAFVEAINTTQPEGGTPTVPALNGAIRYAAKIQADRPGEKTVVVFVTDGEPGFVISGQFVPGCQNMPNTIDQAASLAKTAFETKQIPTYVVGVGPSLDKLNTIAYAGGTNAAMMVDVSDPTKTVDQIRTSLNEIRRREATCDFAVPPPPAGQELDPYAVNVVLQKTDGSQTVLGYSKDCADASGWQYDDPNAPKRILLCASACGDVKAAADGKVSIAFGCKTKLAVR